MLMKPKIGLGLVTYNRENYFKKSFESVPKDGTLDEIVIVNDGTPYNIDINVDLIQHDKNKGVGISKNDAFKYLLSKNCDYIFLMEDDIIIKDKSVFDRYINAHKETGIHHFNYSQHGLMNKIPNTETPKPISTIEYKNTSIQLYLHCVGAFSFYTKKCLDKVGLMDENFYNATEHLEHTYNIIKAGMHPPFWWFADINESNKYLSDIPWTISSSTISSNPNHRNIVNKSYEYFKNKHKLHLLEIPRVSLEETKNNLKFIYKNK
jgi:glycosyltransferase involved in cell wall biosynthesis